MLSSWPYSSQLTTPKVSRVMSDVHLQAVGGKGLEGDGYVSADATGPDALDAALLQEQRSGSPGRHLNASSLSRFGSQGSVGTDTDPIG